jgi:hypothetical protein
LNAYMKNALQTASIPSKNSNSATAESGKDVSTPGSKNAETNQFKIAWESFIKKGREIIENPEVTDISEKAEGFIKALSMLMTGQMVAQATISGINQIFGKDMAVSSAEAEYLQGTMKQAESWFQSIIKMNKDMSNKYTEALNNARGQFTAYFKTMGDVMSNAHMLT